MGVIAAAWVIIPLVARRRAVLGDASPASLEDVAARQRVALASLKEVEYDRISGKLDEHDYQQLKAQLQREALTAIAAAEAAPASKSGESPSVARPISHDCGFVNPPLSRFCAGCGRRLS